MGEARTVFFFYSPMVDLALSLTPGSDAQLLDPESPMAALRFLAAVFLLVAAIALVVDATPAIYGAGPFEATALSVHWKDVAPRAFEAAHAAISSVSPWIWASLIRPILAAPTFVIFGVLAVLSGYAGRRRKGVRIFVN